MEQIREKLIKTILKYSSDELDELDWINIAMESDKQLVNRIINILEFYHEKSNN